MKTCNGLVLNMERNIADYCVPVSFWQNQSILTWAMLSYAPLSFEVLHIASAILSYTAIL